MKWEEKIAQEFLKAHFGADTEYEPLGHGAPPDFRIGTTAFEVRRLNENRMGGDGKIEGLEKVTHELDRAVFGELGRIPFSPERGSFFVGLKYQRPLHDKTGKIAKELAKKARLHYSEGSRAEKTVEAGRVTAELIPASASHGRAFVRGFEVDGESGGLVSEIYGTNIGLALKEKIAKTKRLAGSFSCWVLLLVDSIAPGMLAPEDLETFTLDLQHFRSVAIINPWGSLACDWPKGSLTGAA